LISVIKGGENRNLRWQHRKCYYINRNGFGRSFWSLTISWNSRGDYRKCWSI